MIRCSSVSRVSFGAALLGIIVLPCIVSAQRPRGDVADIRAERVSGDANVASVLGITITLSANARDTLGALVASVAPGSPAEHAGIDQGNRIADINGIALNVDAADVRQPDAESVVQRRLSRAVRGLAPGSDVSMRVFAAGRYRTVHLTLPGTPAFESAKVTIVTRDTQPAAPTLSGVVDGIGQLRSQLRQLARSENAGISPDSLDDADQQLAMLQRQLRDAASRQQRASAFPSVQDESGSSSGGDALVGNGLHLAPVNEALADYFGDEAVGGLLVVEADASWAPLRKGDVILRVNGTRPDAGRLRQSYATRRVVRVEILRRQRTMTVTIQSPA
jgi:hypothetical protein